MQDDDTNARYNDLLIPTGSSFVEGTSDQTCTCIVRPQPLQYLND